MNWSSWLLWGFLATLVLTSISEVTQGLGLTRMNIPFLMGTMVTPDRDKAKLYGFFMHLVFGWAFSLVYVAILVSLGAAGWWRGLIIGIAQAFFLLVAVVNFLPGIHPRMANEQQGPEAGNLLEPPGFLALNYGARTPFAIIFSHAIFGAILGAFYHLK
jgi:hypothetical protein